MSARSLSAAAWGRADGAERARPVSAPQIYPDRRRRNFACISVLFRAEPSHFTYTAAGPVDHTNDFLRGIVRTSCSRLVAKTIGSV